MYINQIINRFSLEADFSTLEIFIGKNINKQMFNINNKIFFDVIYTWLIKNGWFIQNQYILKSVQSKDVVLESIINNDISDLLDFEIPFTSQSKLYKKNNDTIKKYKGTYYDILCNHYTKQYIELDDFQQHIDSIYNETIEEVTIFHTKSIPVTIQLNLERISSQLNAYTVKVIITDTINNEEPLLELFDIIDMAMAKYKKTDRTIASIFELIN